MCFNPGPERRVPSPNRYIAVASFCFCKNNKRSIIIRFEPGRACEARLAVRSRVRRDPRRERETEREREEKREFARSERE
jgi:hypothetical protein